jgi:Spy/CpxP family protein refolding chaperone
MNGSIRTSAHPHIRTFAHLHILNTPIFKPPPIVPVYHSLKTINAMKRFVVSLFAILMIGVAAQAQEKSGTQDGKQHHKRHGKHHKREIAKELNLSDAQKEQLKSIREESRKQLAELKKNENITVKEAKERRKAIHDQQRTKMQSLLTAEQKQKMEQLKLEHKNKRGHRHPGDKVRTERKANTEKIHLQQSAR